MSEVELHFVKPGMNTLIQDSGRPGFQKFGVPVGGFMDKNSAQAANWLVGNNLNSALIEITMMGPVVEIDKPCQLAITGADISPLLNNEPVPMYETISVPPNSTLSFGKLKSGCRAYLAFRGKLNVNSWLESSSSTSFEKDLTPQSIVSKGSKILLVLPKEEIETRSKPRVEFPTNITVRVLPGPEYNIFEGEQLQFFLNQSFTINKDSNRMGYRLDEALPDFTNKIEVISSAVIPGTIQIANSAQPMILMADAQTSGGYPRICNIISPDLDKVAQLKPGEKISFKIITLADAENAT